MYVCLFVCLKLLIIKLLQLTNYHAIVVLETNKQRRRTEQQRCDENLMNRSRSRGTDDGGPNLAEGQQAECISRVIHL